MAPRLLVAPHGERARAALWAAVEEAKAGDPLAPVTVAVPSTYAGLALRRALGRRRGLVNVRFTALARVAELLGAPDLAAAGLRPLAGPLRNEAVYATLAADPGFLAPVADHPSTEQALSATFRDLRDAPDASRRALAAGGVRPAKLVALYDDFRSRTRDYYDEADLALAAAKAVGEAPERLADVGHVVVHLPRGLSPAEEALVDALAAAGRATVVLGLTNDETVDAAVAHRLATRLEPRLGPAHQTDPPTDLFGFELGGAPVGTAVLSTPDPEDEVRAVARRIASHAADGLPLHRIGVVARVEEPYGRLVPEVLGAAGIAWNGATPQRLADTTVGRVLRGLLDLAEHDFARDAVAAWLSSGPVIDPVERRAVDAARYDIVSREAGVVGGAAQWQDRLARHAINVEAVLTDPEVDELPEWRRSAIERELETVRRLAAFVAQLVEDVRPPEPADWSGFARWARELLDRYLGGETRWAAWPDAELDAGRQVRATLEGLGALDTFGAPVDLPRFRRAVTTALDTPAARLGTFGTGVFVGTLHQAYAGDFDVLYVLGTVEGAFPPRGREDPLLPDRDRRTVTGLELHRERRVEERHDYLAALASAPERTLCFARADARAQRRLLPSRWLLETARALRGSELSAEGLRDAVTPEPWLEVVESFEQGVGGDAEPGSPVEYDLASLLTWLDRRDPIARHPLAVGELRAGFDLQAARGSSAYTAYDGNVAGRAAIDGDDRVVSPTSLETWATCPFHYLLGSVLRLRDVPRPEETQTISALEEGSLIHGILEDFVRRAPRRTTPDQGWSDAERTLALEIAEERCAGAEARGVTGRPVAWKLAKRRILRTILRFLTADPEIRADLGVVPSPDGLELAFGLDGKPPVTVPLPDGRVVRFRGRIDRVDVAPDGSTVVVFDYKTGSSRNYDPITGGDPVVGGKKLQLPVYALAAEQLHPDAEAHAYYWFTRYPGVDALIGYEADHCRDRFEETLTTIAEGVRGGCFPAVPGEREWVHWLQRETFRHCSTCEFDRLCPVDREPTWLRKSGADEIRPFLSLDPELLDGAEADDDAEAET